MSPRLRNNDNNNNNHEVNTTTTTTTSTTTATTTTTSQGHDDDGWRWDGFGGALLLLLLLLEGRRRRGEGGGGGGREWCQNASPHHTLPRNSRTTGCDVKRERGPWWYSWWCLWWGLVGREWEFFGWRSGKWTSCGRPCSISNSSISNSSISSSSSCSRPAGWGGVSLTLLLTLTLLMCGCPLEVKAGSERGARNARDYRFTGYDDLLVEGRKFENASLVGYTQLVMDEVRGQLLVGARDALYRLSLDELQVLEATDWRSQPGIRSDCINSGQDREACHNFVRVLLLHKDNEVFTCGTNAFDPMCTWRQADQLSTIRSTISGKAICPYGPLHNTTALMTSKGELYTATIIDKLARDPSINRNLGAAPNLRTEQMNSKWLNEPNFVSTYEFGNFVYFFFREIAVEYINCGKKVYSRAARVCKTDRGGSILLEGKWTTFHKARLNCSLPGNFPFYFDELQSTFYSQDEKLVYAVFTTPPNSIAGSAVCAYNMTAFDEAFNGPFKHQKDSMSAWMRHENGHSENRKCVAESGNSKRSSEKSPDRLVMAQKYQLMDHAVQPASLLPIVVKEQERWTHLVVDHVVTKRDLVDVLFLATEDGKIQKMMRLSPSSPSASPSLDPFSPASPSPPVTCLVEEMKIVPNGHPRPVKAMRLSPDQGAIYLATDGNILKVPVQRCSRFKDSRACLSARDPYCGWDTRRGRCTPPPEDNPHADFWEQDVSACPSLDNAEDGGWSLWSDWSKCQQVGGDPMMDQCQCRMRTCDSPKPINGGRRCIGASIEVTNCTIHGQWTAWSEWSACSQTCGYALRERRRQCGNPPPRFGGRACVGADSDRQYCNDLIACPLPPVNGHWATWSGWSACTKDCNGGIQTRRRQCTRPKPSRGGHPCGGNRQEWRMCNTHDCQEISRISPWTEWIQTNRTSGGYFEQRFRFTCRANVPKRKMIKTSYAKSQARFCQNNGHGCQTAGQLRNSITSIDTFTSVDRVLRKFCRYKRKLFQQYCNCRTLGVFLVCQKCGYG